jgi:hypothetical protein
VLDQLGHCGIDRAGSRAEHIAGSRRGAPSPVRSRELHAIVSHGTIMAAGAPLLCAVAQ